jgi:hypothetical protein
MQHKEEILEKSLKTEFYFYFTVHNIGLNGKFLRFRRDGVSISYQEDFTRPELKSL